MNHIDIDDSPVDPGCDAETHKAKIRSTLESAIKAASFIASFTPTTVDDKLVVSLGQILTSDLVIDLLHMMLCGMSPQEAIKAANAKLDS